MNKTHQSVYLKYCVDPFLLTTVYVGVEGKAAVLGIKWKLVEVKRAGADYFDRLRINHQAIRKQINVWDKLC